MRQRAERPNTHDTKIAVANNKAVAGWKVRISEQLSKQRLSQRKLASLSGLGSTSIRHLLTEADTVTLETMRRIANALNQPIYYMTAGVTNVVDGDDSEIKRRIRLLPVAFPTDDPDKVPDERPRLPAALAGRPDKIYALKVTTGAMRPDRQNEPIAADEIVLPGDVVLWSPALAGEPGQLVVARISGQLSVRKLVMTDEGKLQLVAWNSAFGRLFVKPADILGRVLVLHRECQSL
jgi:SOS-response transcriptional repressor LexA